MSHATVLVISDSPDEVDDMMAPYNENTEVDEYKQYESVDPTEWPCRALADDGIDITQMSTEEIARALNDRWSMREYETDENGLFTRSTYNPESKWDWYQIGGRWPGMLWTMKPDAGARGGVSWASQGFSYDPHQCDQARRGDLDLHKMYTDIIQRRLESWDEAWKEENATFRHSFIGFNLDQKWTSPDQRDEYLKEVATKVVLQPPLSTYAVLTNEGWHEPGQMGWFGMSAADDEDRDEYSQWWKQFWPTIPDDAWLTVVDYHI